ncbi:MULTISPECIES: rod shape-determining protein MreD [unclassified Polaribacter]|uniref:rod shape-determining protein MreD n=1 Tax=unclassified Polaribacter TaxID=196858 RepID=UPI0011BED457|nr:MULTISPECIES: rod shape-determining protein MreD [unclassified Polaribacter]TXD53248.1 rod shape-determining protein MreD [Polaribacter sp. IC063]TXD61394.1 rod shape-determining protein MreD [Polaribacter sp. IC066]
MSKTINLVFLFFFLLFLQVFVLNNILFFGYINPYAYVAFVFLYPLKENRIPFLFYSFLLGLFIDFFSDSGGIHAFSLLSIAYIRLFFIKLYFRKVTADYPFFNLKSESFGKVFNYTVTLTIIHHLIYFSFANFSLQNYSTVLLNVLFSSIFTLTLYFLGTYIFMKSE